MADRARPTLCIPPMLEIALYGAAIFLADWLLLGGRPD
jgi:hypothetical protein